MGDAGRGGHDGAVEREKRSLFSWADFMAELPEKQGSRSRKPDPATLSMFEWAHTLEHERYKEEVAGHCSLTVTQERGALCDTEGLPLRANVYGPLLLSGGSYDPNAGEWSTRKC